MGDPSFPPVVVATEAQIQIWIQEAVEQAMLQTMPAMIRRALRKPYLTKRDLMELTGWSARQVDYRKADGSLPYVQRGRTILFPTDEVEAFLEAGRVPASRAPKRAPGRKG